VLVPDRKLIMKMSRQFRIAATLLVGGIVVASSACSVDGINPTSSERSLSPTASPLAIEGSSSGTDAQISNSGSGSWGDLSSLTDGSYTFNIDPRIDQVVTVGGNRVVLPASSVCAIGTSGYGPTMWDYGCNPQKKPFTLRVTVAGSGTENAALDFQPSLRFDPTKTVTMDISVPQLSAGTPYSWTIFYCPTPSGKPGSRLGTSEMRADPTCVDESLTDPSLRVRADYENHVLSRRLKHFSAYQIERGGYTVVE
jgi:hypothetical protein